MQQSDNQLEQIANLQSQIADARRYAAIGDARCTIEQMTQPRLQ